MHNHLGGTARKQLFKTNNAFVNSTNYRTYMSRKLCIFLLFIHMFASICIGIICFFGDYVVFEKLS